MARSRRNDAPPPSTDPKEDLVDVWGEDSFPASDPPTSTPERSVGPSPADKPALAGGPDVPALGPRTQRPIPLDDEERDAQTRTASAAERQPTPPFPPQHQARPGREAELEPRPRYAAPEYRAAGKLAGKVALITGGDSGIGRAVAVLYAREGADVALVFLPEEAADAEETRDAVAHAGRQALLIPGDVTDPAFCREAVSETVRHFGRLDILVNNAAYQQHCASLDELTEAQWDRTFRTNIYGYFHMARAALVHMERGAVILNTGSITGLEGSAKLLDYSATKGAIHAFTKSLAQNLTPRGIRVNCVAPGPVWTPLNPADRPAEEVAHFGESTQMGRPAQPEEIAPAYVFFASGADSGYITGEVLTLLGGDTRAA